MIKSIVLLVCLAFVTFASHLDPKAEFEKYKANFNKIYVDSKEEAKRFQIFAGYLKLISERNEANLDEMETRALANSHGADSLFEDILRIAAAIVASG